MRVNLGMESFDPSFDEFLTRAEIANIPSLRMISVNPIVRATITLGAKRGLSEKKIDELFEHVIEENFHLKILGKECTENFANTVRRHLMNFEILVIICHGSQWFTTEQFIIEKMLPGKFIEVHGIDHDYPRKPFYNRMGIHNTHLDLPLLPWDATVSMFVWQYPSDCTLGYKHGCRCEMNYSETGCHDYQGLLHAVHNKTKFIIVIDGVTDDGRRCAGTELFAELIDHIIATKMYIQALKMTWPSADKEKTDNGMVIGRLLRYNVS